MKETLFGAFLFSGSDCSKLKTSLVNVSLKLQLLISELHSYFFFEKILEVSVFFFLTKNICVFGYKVEKHLTYNTFTS